MIVRNGENILMIWKKRHIIFLITTSILILVWLSGCAAEHKYPTNSWTPVKRAAANSKPSINMVLVYFDDYKPFSWKDENGEMKGILIDILNETINKRMDVPITHEGYPWIRAQELVKTGKADAFCTFPSEARKSYTNVSKEAVVDNRVYLYSNPHNPKIEEIKKVKIPQDLKPFKIGSYNGDGWVKQNLNKMDIAWTSSPKQVLEMVASQRVDVYSDFSTSTYYLIKEMNLKQSILEIPVDFENVSFNLCVGKNSPYVNILPKFDEVMKQIKADGTYQSILDRYK
jgi:polar amino acid transport system substrate-binding protein